MIERTFLVNIQATYEVTAATEDEAIELAETHGRLMDSDTLVEEWRNS